MKYGLIVITMIVMSIALIALYVSCGNQICIPSKVVICPETGLENGYCEGVYSSSQHSELTLNNCMDILCPIDAPYIFYMNDVRKCRCIDGPYPYGLEKEGFSTQFKELDPCPFSPGKGFDWYELGNKCWITEEAGWGTFLNLVDCSEVR